MRVGKSRIFLLLCLGFLFGVFLGRYLGVYVMAGLAVFFIVLITVWGFSTGSISTNNKQFLVIGFVGLALIAGAWRWQGSFGVERRADFVGRLAGQKVELTGIIVREPDVREDRTNLTWQPEGHSGRVLLSIGRSLAYQYGDRLRVAGKLQAPFESEEFSYKNYLSRYETYAVMYYPEVERLSRGHGLAVKRWLLALKLRLQDVIAAVLPIPHDSLMLGLILGLKRGLPQDLANALLACGVSHIIVISGYNISIITRNIMKGRPWLGRRIAFWLSLFMVTGFVAMTGAESSSIRAAVMGLLVVFALNVGRIFEVRLALVAAATAMVALSPKILAFDIGFQLSFMATAGLVFLSPVFDRWFEGLSDRLSFRSSLSSSLAAIAFTLPLQMYYFDQFSPVALLVNVLVLWVIPYAMFFGFFAALAGLVYLPLGHFVASSAWLCLEYVIRVVKFFARAPLAAGSVKVGLTWVAVYYVSLFAWIGFYLRGIGASDPVAKNQFPR